MDKRRLGEPWRGRGTPLRRSAVRPTVALPSRLCPYDNEREITVRTCFRCRRYRVWSEGDIARCQFQFENPEGWQELQAKLIPESERMDPDGPPCKVAVWEEEHVEPYPWEAIFGGSQMWSQAQKEDEDRRDREMGWGKYADWKGMEEILVRRPDRGGADTSNPESDEKAPPRPDAEGSGDEGGEDEETDDER